MSPKVKMFLIYGISFLVLFMAVWFLAGLFFDDDSWPRKLAPILGSIIAAPKPHVEEYQNDKRYGLKSIFIKKIFWM